jgi:CO/xanthine dehydrogenase FAD-binding subunit
VTEPVATSAVAEPLEVELAPVSRPAFEAPERTPSTLAEALALLAAEPDRLPIAGCTDLMVAEPLARASRGRILNLLALPELRGIREVPTGIEIGATTTFAEIGAAAIVGERFPALAAAAREIGGWQIQNRATLGGNAVNASPAGDSLPVLLALDATALVASAAGARAVPYDEFHLGYRKTALGPGELLVAVRLPFPAVASVQAFRKVGPRAAQAISKVMVAMLARVENGYIAQIRLAAGSVAATPVRLRAAEAATLGRAVGPEAANAAGRAAAAEVQPIDDVRSSAEYRRFVLERVVRRMVLGLV